MHVLVCAGLVSAVLSDEMNITTTPLSTSRTVLTTATIGWSEKNTVQLTSRQATENDEPSEAPYNWSIPMSTTEQNVRSSEATGATATSNTN